MFLICTILIQLFSGREFFKVGSYGHVRRKPNLIFRSQSLPWCCCQLLFYYYSPWLSFAPAALCLWDTLKQPYCPSRTKPIANYIQSHPCDRTNSYITRYVFNHCSRSNPVTVSIHHMAQTKIKLVWHTLSWRQMWWTTNPPGQYSMDDRKILLEAIGGWVVVGWRRVSDAFQNFDCPR